MKAFRYVLAVSLLLCSAILKSQTHDLTQGLVFHLSFDGNATDQSTSAIPVVQVLSPTLVDDRNANATSALEFANLNQSLALDDSDVGMMEFGTSDFSIGLWVKKNSTTSNYNNAAGINKWHSGLQPTYNAWALNIGGGDGADSNKPTFRIQIGATYYTAMPATKTVDVGQWTHLMGVREGTDIKLYVDGVLESTVNVGSGAVAASTPRDVLISRFFVNGEHSNATFDDIVVYDKALSQSEIDELMLYGVTPGNQSNPTGGNANQGFDLTQGVLLHLPLDNSSADASSFSHQIIEHGSPLASVADRNDEIDKAVGLNGINESIEIDYSSTNFNVFEFGANDFSIGFWVKKLAANGLNGENSAGVSAWESGASLSTSEWSFAIGGGSGSGTEIPSFGVSINGNTYHKVVAAYTPVAVGQWAHLMASRNGADLNIYVNGILRGTTNIGTGSITDAQRDLLIGRSFQSNHTEAEFDDIVVYDRALTIDEIAQLMTYGVTNGDNVVGSPTSSLWVDAGNDNIYYDKGSVSIGIDYNNIDYSLAVKGKILAESIHVQTYPTWPDFVFANDYDLKKLSEVEAYIKKNGHLPGVPSAKQVEGEGFNLENMDATLLQKIEELMLYTIEQQKLLQQQKMQIDSLIEKVRVLEKKN